jgi:glycosyltransferase involved in cell wall biosynthesis
MSPVSFSIVTPCLNSERFLQETINSVAAQRGDFTLEYIVVDGGSSDGTLDIIKNNGHIISRWISERDDGMYCGIAKGFQLSSGEIMGWLNSDDIYFPWALDYVAKVFSALPQVQWVSTLSPTVIDAAGDIRRVRKLAGFSREAFLDGVYVGFGGLGDSFATEFIQQESTFWRRSLWDAECSDVIQKYRAAGDFALWCGFIDRAPLYGVEPPLGAFRVHEGQLSKSREAYLAEAKHALEGMRSRSGYAQRRSLDQRGAMYDGHYVRKAPGSATVWVAESANFAVLPRSSEVAKKLVREFRVF